MREYHRQSLEAMFVVRFLAVCNWYSCIRRFFSRAR